MRLAKNAVLVGLMIGVLACHRPLCLAVHGV